MDKRVLVVDDDRLIREMTRDALVQEGFRVATAASGREALSRLGDEGPFDLVITDLSMREMDGLELLERVKRASPHTEVIVLTGYASLESALQAMRLGAADYLRKPVSAPEITYGVKRTMLRRRLIDENESLRGSVQAFEAARPLASCLESGDVLPLGLDILLRVTGRARAIGRLVDLPSHAGEGLELRGFPEGRGGELRALIESGKLFDTSDLERAGASALEDASAVPGALEADLGQVLALPIRVEGRIAGGMWLCADGRPFGRDEIERAELVVEQAELALINSERFLQAREKAFVDDVTSLYNARYLLSALDREVNRADRSQSKLSVLFLDLDRFKAVNDRYGHLIGSRVLRELGALLQESVRAIDTVGRYGGDEFTILLVDTGLEGALSVADRIRQSVADRSFGAERGLDLRLTISVGVATFPMHGESRERLLDLADKAMYLAKALGRNLVCSADDLSQPTRGPGSSGASL
ncbi:MAG TPA: diguanylate cyclase [Myxococcota bacterium]|nr:diguanylate cyclase [Myxococcota bacterium]